MLGNILIISSQFSLNERLVSLSQASILDTVTQTLDLVEMHTHQ